MYVKYKKVFFFIFSKIIILYFCKIIILFFFLNRQLSINHFILLLKDKNLSREDSNKLFNNFFINNKLLKQLLLIIDKSQYFRLNFIFLNSCICIYYLNVSNFLIPFQFT